MVGVDCELSEYTHRAASAKDTPERQKRDRVVIHDGDIIGRVYQITGGPQGGKWLWTLMWTPPQPYKNIDRVDTMEEGLAAIREAHQRPVDDPDRAHIRDRNNPPRWRRHRSNGS